MSMKPRPIFMSFMLPPIFSYTTSLYIQEFCARNLVQIWVTSYRDPTVGQSSAWEYQQFGIHSSWLIQLGINHQFDTFEVENTIRLNPLSTTSILMIIIESWIPCVWTICMHTSYIMIFTFTWGFPKMVVPNNDWFFLLNMTILGCEMGGTTILGDTHIHILIIFMIPSI